VRLLFITLCTVMLAVGLSSETSAADRFDVVVINHILIRTYTQPDLPTGGGYSFVCGLIVNTGTTPITNAAIVGARLSGVAAAGNIPWGPGAYHFLIMADAGLASDLLPGEAVGYVNAWTDTLLTLLQPEEAFRNEGALVMQVSYYGYFAGALCYDVTMSLGGQEVHFPVQVDVVQVPSGQQGAEVLGAVRVSSSPVVPALATSWGRIKSLYR
jgi:hypothetical protein